MKKNEKGFVEGIIAVIIVFIFMSIFFVGWKPANETVSGIVYNTTNNRFISDTTQFSVRASEATYTTEENKSTFCLPPNSPYKDLVNRAAADKRIKVTVTAGKYFTIKAPWTCQSNVTVRMLK